MFTNTILPPGRTRRSFTREFKAEVIGQCLSSGESIASIAQQYHLNASQVHGWLRKHSTSVGAGLGETQRDSGFVPLMLASAVPHSAAITTEAPASAVTHSAHHGGGLSTEAPGPQLRIELGRGEMTLTVHWPISHAQDSATWIRQVLA